MITTNVYVFIFPVTYNGYASLLCVLEIYPTLVTHKKPMSRLRSGLATLAPEPTQSPFNFGQTVCGPVGCEQQSRRKRKLMSNL